MIHTLCIYIIHYVLCHLNFGTIVTSQIKHKMFYYMDAFVVVHLKEVTLHLALAHLVASAITKWCKIEKSKTYTLYF